MCVLVIDCLGNIGLNISNHLYSRGFNVRALGDYKTSSAISIFHSCDQWTVDSLRSVIKRLSIEHVIYIGPSFYPTMPECPNMFYSSIVANFIKITEAAIAERVTKFIVSSCEDQPTIVNKSVSQNAQSFVDRMLVDASFFHELNGEVIRHTALECDDLEEAITSHDSQIPPRERRDFLKYGRAA